MSKKHKEYICWFDDKKVPHAIIYYEKHQITLIEKSKTGGRVYGPFKCNFRNTALTYLKHAVEDLKGIYTVEYWIDNDNLYYDFIAYTPDQAINMAKEKFSEGTKFKII